MWRRIHTLYLALAALLIAAMFFMKFATVVAPDGEEDIMYYEMIPTALLMLSALCANGVAVFTYKNRLLQMRLASTAALVCLALQKYLAYPVFRADDQLVFSISMAFPLVASILDFLAFRAIITDDIAVFTAIRTRGKKKEDGEITNP